MIITNSLSRAVANSGEAAPTLVSTNSGRGRPAGLGGLGLTTAGASDAARASINRLVVTRWRSAQVVTITAINNYSSGMADDLIQWVAQQLDADIPLSDEVGVLVLAALEGDASLDECLEGGASSLDVMTNVARDREEPEPRGRSLSPSKSKVFEESESARPLSSRRNRG